jgi:thiosulfate/3-mercaptopyruvate sulfurtransferase
MSMISRRAALGGMMGACAAAGCGLLGADSAELGPLLAPAALAERLHDVKAGKIAVFYVGPELLYDLAHVPGARKLGPVSEPAVQDALRQAVGALPADTEVVLYCGCCPIRNCPNIRPGSALIRALKRPSAHWLDLPTNFATDWTDKGYPVESV